MKIYNTRPVSLTIEGLLIKILIFSDHWSSHLFQSNQRFQAIEFVDRTVLEKFDIFRINLSYKLSSQTCRALQQPEYVVGHVANVIPSFHGLR